MEKYKIENTAFTFDVDGLFTDYTLINGFPIRPSKIEDLEEILFQVTEMRDDLHELQTLIIYETHAYQYVIGNRKRSYSSDVYLTIYKIHKNGLREIVKDLSTATCYLEEYITEHISSHLEWSQIQFKKDR